MGRDTFHYSRLLQAASNSALDTSRGEQHFESIIFFPFPGRSRTTTPSVPRAPHPAPRRRAAAGAAGVCGLAEGPGGAEAAAGTLRPGARRAGRSRARGTRDAGTRAAVAASSRGRGAALSGVRLAPGGGASIGGPAGPRHGRGAAEGPRSSGSGERSMH